VELKMNGRDVMKAEAESWRNPLLDDFLRAIRFRSGLYFRPQFRAPWGIRVARNCVVFHIVDHGDCWLEVNGVTEPIWLSEGDFVVVTRGDAHIMRDRLSTTAEDFFDLAKTHRFAENPTFRAGGKGSITTLVCGGAHLETGANNSLIGMLPPVLHLKRTEEGAEHWLGLTTEQILAELRNGGTGAKEIITRLVDVLFIRAVREYFDQNIETAESGRLAAARDGRIGRALAMLHGHPQQAWTVDSLARHVALSRSAFAARFTELVGEPPLHYLTRLRIDLAAARLRSSDDKLRAIAAASGYESVAAFAKSFKRLIGMTPGEYRRVG
jgi:AraC-like DNA-binding protein